MTMTIGPAQQRYAAQGYDNMSTYSQPAHPQFTNPFAQGMYASSASVAHGALPSHNHMAMDRNSQQTTSRTPATTTAPMAQYGSVPVTSASAGSPFQSVAPTLAVQSDLRPDYQDMLSMPLPHATTAPYADTAYHTTAASPVQATYAASPTSYHALSYPTRHSYSLGQDHADAQNRRYSQSSVSSSASSYDPVDLAAALPRAPRSSHIDFPTGRGISAESRGFREALEASQGMMNMKYADTQETPRAGVYNNRGRGSGDSYGFPSTHSTSSSISSTGYPYSYTTSGDTSDYSTAGSDIESVGTRTLRPPQGVMSTQQPPAPQSMMSQFSSKVSSSTQKKHKCKVCDKRFTRPSSLQTHMYSHTGEKRKHMTPPVAVERRIC